jgi:hypothetical protein
VLSAPPKKHFNAEGAENAEVHRGRDDSVPFSAKLCVLRVLCVESPCRHAPVRPLYSRPFAIVDEVRGLWPFAPL